MKTLKKTLCLVLAVVMAVGVLVIPAHATGFDDDAKITHDEAVSVLSGLGIVNGVGDGSNFDPDGTFTRAQAAALLAQVVLTPDYAAILDSSKAVFSDVPVTSGYNKYITWAVEQGHIHGYPDGTFKPNQELTGTELAALMLEVLGEKIDAANYKNFVNTTAKDKGLLKGIDGYVPSAVISRDDAVQMMFNTMNTNTASKTVWYVHVDGSSVRLYTSDSETNALLVATNYNAVDADKVYVVDKEVSAVGSILQKTYGAKYYDTYDQVGRPFVEWDDKDGNPLYSAYDTPVKEYNGPVKYNTIFADIGKNAYSYTTTYQDGVVIEALTQLDRTRNTYVGTADADGYGVITEVYADGTYNGFARYRVIQLNPYYAQVADVEETTLANNKKVVSVDFALIGDENGAVVDPDNAFLETSYKFDADDFSVNDYVMLNLCKFVDDNDTTADTSDDITYYDVYDAYVLDTVTGTLERTVTKGGIKTYTIDGKVYNENVDHTALPYEPSVNSTVTLRLDQFGHLVSIVDAPEVSPNYIMILNSINPEVISGGQTWKYSTSDVFGILSDGTYGTYKVNYVGNASTYVTTQPAVGLYRYTTNSNGEMLLFLNDGGTVGHPTANITANGAGAAYVTLAGSPQRVILNSNTLFVYYVANANNTFSTFITRTGNSTIQANDITTAAYVGLSSALSSTKVAKVVFMGSAPAVTGPSADNFAYINVGTKTTVEEQIGADKVTRVYYTAVKSDGTEVTVMAYNGANPATAVEAAAMTTGIYKIGASTVDVAQKKTGQIDTSSSYAVHGRSIRLVENVLTTRESFDKVAGTVLVDAAHNYTATPVFVGSNKKIENNEYWAIYDINTNNFTSIWFVANGNVTTDAQVIPEA